MTCEVLHINEYIKYKSNCFNFLKYCFYLKIIDEKFEYKSGSKTKNPNGISGKTI